MPYRPNYAMYSRAPQGWHDEPFEYVFSYDTFFGSITVVNSTQFDFFNNPLQMDPDADFFMRGIAIQIDNLPSGEAAQEIFFNMRLRDSFGRALDNTPIALQTYATNPGIIGAFAEIAGSPVATAWYPELYCPANSALWADFQCQNVPAGPNTISFSFHLYFQGIKRFQNEDCKPNSTTPSSASGKQSPWFEGNAA